MNRHGKWVLVFSLLVTGCDALDCVVNDHPEFSKNSLAEATLNQVYEDSIRASISNSIEDSDYNYTFNLEGDLPAGIAVETSAREIAFTGTPTVLGEFPLRLSVFANARLTSDPDDAPSRLCSDTESREMVLSVVQGF